MRKHLKLILVLGVLCLFVGSVFLYLGHRAVKAKGYAGIKEYLFGVSKGYANSLNVEPANIKLKLSKGTIARMKEQREKALNENLMLNIGDNYHDGELSMNDKQSDIQIRLKGHMTDHLQDKKWSFRIKDADPDVIGLSRFTLQHPGTRNYIYEWVFHQLAKYEGIVHLDYRFVNVEINEESWGIYALEEHFGDELLLRNQRPKGAIIRFDPTLYWQGRLNEKHRINVQEDYHEFSASTVDVFTEGKVYKDEVLKTSYEKAIYLLESFRRGSLSTSDIFDVDLMARYLAIIDLVGGYHSLDWSDVKFYMNPEKGLLEPVAYESFGVRKLPQLSGAGRFSKNNDVNDFHTQLFSDPVFFAAYMKAVNRICSRSYFDNFLERIGKALNHQQAILSADFPLKPFTPQIYFYNINIARRSIDLPDPLTVYLNDVSKKDITLVFHNASQYPLRVTAVGEDGKFEKTDIIISPKAQKQLVQPELYLIKNTFGKKVKEDKLEVIYEVPGGKPFMVEVKPFKYDYKGFEEDLKKLRQNSETPIDTLSNIEMDSTLQE